MDENAVPLVAKTIRAYTLSDILGSNIQVHPQKKYFKGFTRAKSQEFSALPGKSDHGTGGLPDFRGCWSSFLFPESVSTLQISQNVGASLKMALHSCTFPIESDHVGRTLLCVVARS